jgi:glycerophosphoryl diester phosphodiesterase
MHLTRRAFAASAAALTAVPAMAQPKTRPIVIAHRTVFVQCFEAAPLRTFKTLSEARRVQLIGRQTPQMVSREGKAIAAYADGVGPDWSMILATTAEGALRDATPLIAEAHALGLAVHPWTVRAENLYLPPTLRRGTSPADHGDAEAVCRALFAAGVDGLFSDFPSVAVAARG